MSVRTLLNEHVLELEKRAVSKEFALQSLVWSISSIEAQRMGFATNHGGICFDYPELLKQEEVSTRRIKRLAPGPVDPGGPKYLSIKGSGMHLYAPHTSSPESIQDAKVPLLITEGEMKALSVAEALEKDRRTFCVLGIAGVNGAWSRGKAVLELPTGEKSRRSFGAPTLISDFEHVALNKRQVWILFDSDVGSPKHAAEFKKSRYKGAMGAEHILAELLRSKGADVRILVIPWNGRFKMGIDDLIAREDHKVVGRLIRESWVSKRDADAILHAPVVERIRLVPAEKAREASKKPDFVIEGLLPKGGTLVLAGPPKFGKSSLAMDAGMSVAHGLDFLGVYPTTKGRAAYIQTEIPSWAMSERLKALKGYAKTDDFFIWTPLRFNLNYYDDEGYKKVATGNQEKVNNLIQALKDLNCTMVILDPLTHFHTLKENNNAHMSHIFSIFRYIARTVPCGITIVHHHRKRSANGDTYEGAEDMRGSIALFSEPDTVLSCYRLEHKDTGEDRLKLLVEARHIERPDPLELMRGIKWTARKWDEYGF